MYRGRTLIELTNVNTGRVDKIESHNTFRADNIAAMLKGQSIYMNDVFSWGSYGREPIWKILTGGIHLYDTALDDENDLYAPAGVKMIANGAVDIVSNGYPTELGSWNAAESTVTNDSIQMVWDWTTSQANNTIGSICLTSRQNGLIGVGNYSKTITTSTNYMDGWYRGTGHKDLYDSYGYIIHGNKLIRPSRYSLNTNSSSGVFTYAKSYLNSSNIDLIGVSNLQRSSEFDGSSMTNDIYETKCTATYNTSGYNYIIGPFNLNNKWRWIMSPTEGSGSTPLTIPAGGTITMLDFDGNTETFTQISKTNTSGAPITLHPRYGSIYGYQSYPTYIKFLNENEMLFVSNVVGESYSYAFPKFKGSLYYMNLSTGDAELIETRDGSNNEASSWFWPGKFRATKSSTLNNMSIYMETNSSKRIADGKYVIYGLNKEITSVFDTTLMDLYPINTQNQIGYIGNLSDHVYTCGTGGWSTGDVYTCPTADFNRLATINNISPVTKTSSQTMKVVYTLERADS